MRSSASGASSIPVLDPTNEATYALLGEFLGEMAALFPDRFIHIGGDENNGVQWNANPRIQAFIREHGLKGNEGLHAYFNRRIAAILAKDGKRLVGWDEIINPELPRTASSTPGAGPRPSRRRPPSDSTESSQTATTSTSATRPPTTTSPTRSRRRSPLTPAERAHILGGEATMWSEWVTPGDHRLAHLAAHGGDCRAALVAGGRARRAGDVPQARDRGPPARARRARSTAQRRRHAPAPRRREPRGARDLSRCGPSSASSSP